ncbi:MAG TPA: hypothetical protein EYQ81_15630, partial [Sneathiellales bacterium]|nr:hypothetical protein [Sneathiellales bacterium]
MALHPKYCDEIDSGEHVVLFTREYTAMRLQKFLAECSIASRRGSEKLIEEGRVTVNGELATVGQPVDPHHDDVRFDGSPVLPDKKLYIVFNKPSGVVTT